ncbi:MAG TPA: hypothetical protein DCZ92_11965 [Elusimicrobia bacterium]|nr:MAG: hypothetical protein A2016_01510 [Elusimicrobia bacterium GWF2_62_30]HBA61506.1 hypothetical protein [Elusimicrobiota bacterium]
MKIFHKLSATMIAAALTASALLSIIFFSFQRGTVRSAQEARLVTLSRAAEAMLSEAALAGDPLMAVDYLSDLASSRPELASCELDIGRGMVPVKTRRKAGAPPGGPFITRRIAAGRFSARLNFSSAFLETERKTLLSAVYRDLAGAFLGAMAAAALLALGISWHFTRRLKRLAAEAAAIGEGRFGVKADAAGSDEIAELGAAFNRMSEKLLELENVKKQFTASITHELRSPLGVIETYAGLLLKEKERFTEEDASVFLRIKENAARLANFVTAMLDLAKIERGKMELRLSPEDPLAIAKDAADFFRAKAGEKNIKLLLEPAGGPAKVRLDRELITHVLSNFISNALKFTPEGGTVTVRASLGGSGFRTEVSDTGPGLAPGEAERLFSAFTQGSAAPGHGGTGLGLALAKAIVELHGGKTGCLNSGEGGAVFWFEIPPEMSPQ